MKEDFDYNQVPKNYLHCLYTQCSRSKECLRFRVASRVPPDVEVISVVNRTYVAGKEEKCPYFRHTRLVCFALGITRIFDNLPHTQALKINRILYNYFQRNMYYRIRNKQRLISPEEQSFIREVFRKEGISEEPVFDEYKYEYDW